MTELCDLGAYYSADTFHHARPGRLARRSGNIVLGCFAEEDVDAGQLVVRGNADRFVRPPHDEADLQNIMGIVMEPHRSSKLTISARSAVNVLRKGYIVVPVTHAATTGEAVHVNPETGIFCGRGGVAVRKAVFFETGGSGWLVTVECDFVGV